MINQDGKKILIPPIKTAKNRGCLKLLTPLITLLLMHVEPSIKLAKIISKNCGITFNDARFVITALKRKKYFSDKSSKNQQSITKFFGKKDV